MATDPLAKIRSEVGQRIAEIRYASLRLALRISAIRCPTSFLIFTSGSVAIALCLLIERMLSQEG